LGEHDDGRPCHHEANANGGLEIKRLAEKHEGYHDAYGHVQRLKQLRLVPAHGLDRSVEAVGTDGHLERAGKRERDVAIGRYFRSTEQLAGCGGDREKQRHSEEHGDQRGDRRRADEDPTADADDGEAQAGRREQREEETQSKHASDSRFRI
jgi:hypothetical protein